MVSCSFEGEIAREDKCLWFDAGNVTWKSRTAEAAPQTLNPQL